VKVSVSVTVDRPVGEVFDAMLDVRNEPTWNTQVSSSTLDSGEPLGLGSRFTTVNRGQSYTAEITAYDRPHAATYVVTGKPMTILGAMTFEPEGAGTRVSGEFEFQPHGFMKLVLPLMGSAIRKDSPKQFASFKSFCESRTRS
jgi:uncharacterized membrane protein